jgi:peptide/nickel transport system permease protein
MTAESAPDVAVTTGRSWLASPTASPARVAPAPGFWTVLLRSRLVTVAVVILSVVVLVAALADVLAPYSPAAQTGAQRLQGPSMAHLLGTDDLGRDTLSRFIFGTRVALMASLLAVSVALILGVPVGVVSGYWSGLVDDVVMRLMDGMFAFPPIVLALTIVSVLGPNLVNAMLAIGIVNAPRVARLVRGQMLSVREEEFVLAARCLGASHTRLMWRHVFPGTLAPLVVQTSLSMGFALLAEASLSFLGLGVQPPTPSWGSMLRSAARYLELDPWMAVGPGVAILATILAFNLLGDGLRDTFDPRTRHLARSDTT